MSNRSWRASGMPAIIFLAMAVHALAQSTGTVRGNITDASDSPVPGASVTVRDENTGQERTITTDSGGAYFVPSLPNGTYRVEVKATGMASTTATHLILSVGSTVVQDFTLKVASTSEVIEVQSSAPLIEVSNVSVGAVVNELAVQEVPLNGRHFVDLAMLTPGTVTPPANARSRPLCVGRVRSRLTPPARGRTA
jgi:hypothetical protein